MALHNCIFIHADEFDSSVGGQKYWKRFPSLNAFSGCWWYSGQFVLLIKYHNARLEAPFVFKYVCQLVFCVRIVDFAFIRRPTFRHIYRKSTNYNTVIRFNTLDFNLIIF